VDVEDLPNFPKFNQQTMQHLNNRYQNLYLQNEDVAIAVLESMESCLPLKAAKFDIWFSFPSSDTFQDSTLIK
jgi:hypothetical protein